MDFVETIFPEPEDEGLYRRNLFDHLLRGRAFQLSSSERGSIWRGFWVRDPSSLS